MNDKLFLPFFADNGSLLPNISSAQSFILTGHSIFLHILIFLARASALHFLVASLAEQVQLTVCRKDSLEYQR